MVRILTVGLAALALLLPGRAPGQEFLGKSAADWAKQLQDRDPEVRRSAAFALGRIGSDRYLGFLVKCFSTDEQPATRAMAATAVGDIISGLKELARIHWADVGTALAKQLDQEKDPRVRRGLVYALGAFGPLATPASAELQSALKDQDASVRQNAAWALGRMLAGPDKTSLDTKPLVTALCQCLEDNTALVRRDTATALGDIGLPRAQEAVGPMLDLVERESKKDSGDPVVLKTALEKLIKLVGERDRPRALRLLPCLDNEDPETRLNAAFVLAYIGGEEARGAVPVLREGLKNDEERVQEQAAAALGQLGPVAFPAVTDLADALQDRPALVRRNAAVALGQIFKGFGRDRARPPIPEKVVPQLTRSLKRDTEPEIDVRRYAAEALFYLGPGAIEAAVPTLLELVQSETDPMLRHRCVVALFNAENLKKDRGDEVLVKVLNEKDRETLIMRYDAARVLALQLREEVPEKVVLPTLLDMLTNKNVLLYQGTAARVEGAGAETQQGQPMVKESVGGDGRYLAAQALGWIGKTANKPEVTKALHEAEKDKDDELKKHAREALKLITGD